MKLRTLIYQLIKLYFEKGNCQVDMIIEDPDYGYQIEADLGEIAFSPRGKRVILLSKDFT